MEQPIFPLVYPNPFILGPINDFFLCLLVQPVEVVSEMLYSFEVCNPRRQKGTHLADLGTPVHTLKALMGHSNISTTMKFYIKNNDENSMKAVRGLEGLME